jgi:hypothetical protein
MKAISYIIAAILGFFGLVFIIGAQGQIMRVVVGIVLLAAAGVLIYLTRIRPQVTQTSVVQKIDLSGDVSLEKMTCSSCGASLSKKSIEVKAGAIFINCEHCGSSYQLEEKPRW